MARPRRGSRFDPAKKRTIPPKIREQVFERANGLCELKWDYRCTGLAEEVDHRIAHAAGGADDISNYQAACRQCNRAKGSAAGNIAQGKTVVRKRAPQPNAAGFIPGQYDYSAEQRKAAQKKAEASERARLRNEEMQRLVAEWNAQDDETGL